MLYRRSLDASPKLHRCFTDGCTCLRRTSSSAPDGPRAKSRERYPKGETGNPSGRTKDIVRFGILLMKEFYKTVPANLGGKTINKMQGEIIAMQMIKGAINKGPMAQKLLLQFIVRHEGRLARREEL